jgi:hypothetical protein
MTSLACRCALLFGVTLSPLALAAPGLECRHAFDAAGADAARLETMVELAYAALQAQDIALPASAVQHGLLGVVVEDLCRRHPAMPLRQAVAFAVRVAADAGPAAPARVAARH